MPAFHAPQRANASAFVTMDPALDLGRLTSSQGRPTAPRMHAESLAGTGSQTIVLLHGWGQTHVSLLPMAVLLGGLGTCHLLDLPGFGQSDDPPSGWSTIDYAERVVGWLDEQGIDRVDLVGHSFGGRVAVRLAARHPGRVRSVVLIGGAGLPARRSFRRWTRMKIARWVGAVARRLPPRARDAILRWREATFASADFKAARASLRPVFSRVVAEDLAAEARRIQAPTLLMYGRDDTETKVDVGERYNALIAGSRLVVLDGHGHFPFLGGGAHLCATQIRRFYGDVASGPSA